MLLENGRKFNCLQYAEFLCVSVCGCGCGCVYVCVCVCVCVCDAWMEKIAVCGGRFTSIDTGIIIYVLLKCLQACSRV